jgi:hypothetical protein
MKILQDNGRASSEIRTLTANKNQLVEDAEKFS